MSQLDTLKAKAADAFAGNGGHNWSFDLWRLKARQTVASVERSEEPIDLADFEYWFKRPVVPEAVR